MDEFKEAWNSVDVSGRDFVTIEDLEAYRQRQNYDESLVTKWKSLFDPQGSGVIRLETFCDTLGFNPKEIRGSRGASLPPDVRFISGDMQPEWQLRVVRAVRRALLDSSSMNEVPRLVKAELERQHGQLWHVLAAHGQFWCQYGHEPGYSFVFQLGQRVFIVFRTQQV